MAEEHTTVAMEKEAFYSNLEADPPLGQNTKVETTPGHRESLTTPSPLRGVLLLSFEGGQTIPPSPRDGLQTTPSPGGGPTTVPSTSASASRLVHVEGKRPWLAYPRPPCNLMANLSAIGSSKGPQALASLRVSPRCDVGRGKTPSSADQHSSSRGSEPNFQGPQLCEGVCTSTFVMHCQRKQTIMLLSFRKSAIFIIDICFLLLPVHPQPPKAEPSHPPPVATNNSVRP